MMMPVNGSGSVAVRDDVTCEKIVWEREAVNRGGNNLVSKGGWGRGCVTSGYRNRKLGR